MPKDDKEIAVAEILKTVAALEELERKWLALPEEERLAMPEHLHRFFGQDS